MPITYEIRLCNSCGLRYPLIEDHPFGTRCPVCMGETQVVLSQELRAETRVVNGEKRKSERKVAALLDNIRSAWNVGSILRSADGFGFTHVYLCGITPTGDNDAVIKTSLGAEDSVPWSYHKDAVKLVKGLKAQGWKVYALEEEARSVDLRPAGGMIDENKREVLIVGNEVSGVDPDLLDLSDEIYSIPMHGEKRSFNVAIAFGIAAYALNIQKENL